MALRLLTTDYVDFGDIAAIGGLTEISVAVTVDISSFVHTEMMVGQYNNTDRAFLLWCDTNRMGLQISNTGGGADLYRSRSGLLAAQLQRWVVTWKASPKASEFWRNGVKQTTTVVSDGSPASIRASAQTLRVGDQGTAQVAVDGDYSEVAIWDHVVPDWFAIAYGKGLSPRFYRKGGIFYWQAVNTDRLTDEWGGVVGANSGGANAPHPRIYYPAPSAGRMGFTAPPIITAKTISVAPTQDAAVSIPSGAGTISIKEKDEATV